jgi:hypothetical protein
MAERLRRFNERERERERESFEVRVSPYESAGQDLSYGSTGNIVM